ncbi:hypothetical protein [Saccharothrix xinjiangensis]|uniref:Uncharacterized protein n=1 Tax=Saccharothrix xinjiangensis TaxID=204798 RepID=A0ABV9XZJ4_9PSEU
MTPLAELPVFGGPVLLLDRALEHTGMPLWLRGAVELALVSVVAYLVLRLLAKRLLPWMAVALVRPALGLVGVARVVLLLPDLAVARCFRRAGRVPPELTHAYGSLVMALGDGAEEAVRRGVPLLSAGRRARGWVLTTVLVLAFLAWNNETCAPGAEPACATPVARWTDALTTWVDAQSAEE